MVDISQLVTPSEAAKIVGMSLRQFLYYVKDKRTPEPQYIGVFRHAFFDIREIEEWQPIKKKPGRAKSK